MVRWESIPLLGRMGKRRRKLLKTIYEICGRRLSYHMMCMHMDVRGGRGREWGRKLMTNERGRSNVTLNQGINLLTTLLPPPSFSLSPPLPPPPLLLLPSSSFSPPPPLPLSSSPSSPSPPPPSPPPLLLPPSSSSPSSSPPPSLPPRTGGFTYHWKNTTLLSLGLREGQSAMHVNVGTYTCTCIHVYMWVHMLIFSHVLLKIEELCSATLHLFCLFLIFLPPDVSSFVLLFPSFLLSSLPPSLPPSLPSPSLPPSLSSSSPPLPSPSFSPSFFFPTVSYMQKPPK